MLYVSICCVLVAAGASRTAIFYTRNFLSLRSVRGCRVVIVENAVIVQSEVGMLTDARRESGTEVGHVT